MAVRQRRTRDEPVILLLRVREEDRPACAFRDGGKEPGVHLLVAASPHDHRCGRGGEHLPDDVRAEGHALSSSVGMATGQGEEKEARPPVPRALARHRDGILGEGADRPGQGGGSSSGPVRTSIPTAGALGRSPSGRSGKPF